MPQDPASLFAARAHHHHHLDPRLPSPLLVAAHVRLGRCSGASGRGREWSPPSPLVQLCPGGGHHSPPVRQEGASPFRAFGGFSSRCAHFVYFLSSFRNYSFALCPRNPRVRFQREAKPEETPRPRQYGSTLRSTVCLMGWIGAARLSSDSMLPLCFIVAHCCMYVELPICSPPPRTDIKPHLANRATKEYRAADARHASGVRTVPPPRLEQDLWENLSDYTKQKRCKPSPPGPGCAGVQLALRATRQKC